MTSCSRRWAGVAGLTSTAFSFTTLPLYFVYSGPPPDSNVLTRILLGSFGLVAMIAFACLWGQLLREELPHLGALTAATTAPLLILVGLTYVHFSFEAGAVLTTPEPIDPTREGVLAPAQFLLQGAFGRLLSAAFLAGSAIAITRAGFLPRWVAATAALVAAVQLAFVPSMYFPPDPSHFYGSVGWGATAFAPALLVAWILLASTLLVRERSDSPIRS